MSDIIKIKKTDIISDSVDVINQNFDIIQGIIESDNYVKSLQLGDIETRLNNLENKNNQNFSDLVKDLNDLTEKIEDEFDENNIQDMINKSLTKSASDLEDFIKRTAGQQVYKALGPYATTSTIDGKIEQKLQGYLKQGDLDEYDNYVKNELLAQYNKSSAFTQYQSDADRKYAEVSTIVANSKFYFEKNSNGVDCLYSVTEPVGITNYTSIEDFYDKGKVTLDSNGKVVGLGSKPVKEVVDPTNATLKDLTVLKNLIQICEKLFKTISTEMVTLRQSVGENKAEFDIIAAIKGPDGQDIAASIFAYADKEGSRLILSGDNINLNADKKLKLKSGTFELDSKEMSLNSDGKLTINSENLKLNDDELMMKGNIYATNQNNQITAGIIGARKNTNGNNRVVRFFAGTESTKEGDEYKLLEEDIENAKFKVYDDGHVVAKDIELVFNGNHTSIDEDGILHANGAEISGNVTANKIDVTSTNNTITVKGPGEINYTGNLTYETNISADNFRISVDGELKAESGDSIKIKNTKNYLEFGILDEIDNTNNEIKDEKGDPATKLYGVPSLIMYYNGKPFYLNPTCWLNKGTEYKGGNMRWIKQYDAYNYANPNNIINNQTYTSTSGVLKNNQGRYCIARPKSALENLLNSNGSSSDEVVRLTILEWGENEGDKRTWLKRSGLMNDGDENEGVFTKKSILGSSGYYGNPSFTRTEITEATCEAFKNKVPNSQTVWAKCNFYYYVEWVKDNGEDGKDSIIKKTDFPIKKICTLMHNIAKAQSAPTDGYENCCWGRPGKYIKIVNFDDILPFTEKTITEDRFDYDMGDGDGQYLEINIDYCPFFEIKNGIPMDTTKKIYGKCQIQMGGNNYKNKIQYTIYNSISGSEYENLQSVTLNLNFDFYLELNNATNFSHLDEAQEKFTFCESTDLDKRELLKNVIIKFFENEDIYNTSSINPNDFSFSGVIETDMNRYEKSSWNQEDAWDV